MSRLFKAKRANFQFDRTNHMNSEWVISDQEILLNMDNVLEITKDKSMRDPANGNKIGLYSIVMHGGRIQYQDMVSPYLDALMNTTPYEVGE